MVFGKAVCPVLPIRLFQSELQLINVRLDYSLAVAGLTEAVRVVKQEATEL